MKTWNFNLTSASDVDIFDTLVGYVRFYERTAGGGIDPRIRLKSLGGGIDVELLPGQAYRLATPVRGLVVENMSGTPISGKLSIAPENGNFEDDRITGEVSVVDGSYPAVLGNTVFQGYAELFPVNFFHYQIKNLSTTNPIEILGFDLVMGAASGAFYGLYTGANLTTVSPPPNSVCLNQTGAVPDALCEVRKQDIAAPAVMTVIGQLYAPGAGIDRHRPVKPLVVMPSSSLMIQGKTAAVNSVLTIMYARR